MAVPVVRGVRTVAVNPADTSGTVDVSTLGIVSGDLLIAQVAIDAVAATAITPPSGWTQVLHSSFPNEGGDGCEAAIFEKVAGGSEPSSYTFSFAASEEGMCAVIRIDGQHASAYIDASAQASDNGFSLTDPVAPTVTTTVADCLVLRFYAHGNGLLASPYAPPSHTGIHNTSSDNTTATGGSAQGGAAYIDQASAGASGTAQFDTDLTSVVAWWAGTVAIAPVAGGGGGSTQPPRSMHQFRMR